MKTNEKKISNRFYKNIDTEYGFLNNNCFLLKNNIKS